MLPIGDRNPTRTTPVVNYAHIALNVAVTAALLVYEARRQRAS